MKTQKLLVLLLAATTSLLSIVGCGGSSTAQDNSGPIIAWRFVDSHDTEAVALKQEKLQLMKAFWRDFQQKAQPLIDQLDDKNAKGKQIEDRVSWLSSDVHAIDERLMWEITPKNKPGVSQLAITTEGNRSLQPLVDTMIGMAPHLEHWEFVAYRDGLKPDLVDTGLSARIGRHAPIFSAEVAANQSNQVDVIVISPAFHGENNEDDLGTAVHICELVLGEEFMDKWIGAIRTRQADVSSKSVTEGALHLENDASLVRKKIIATLPKKQMYNLTPPQKTGVMQNPHPSPSIHRLTMVSWNEAFMNSSLDEQFCSERLSRNGERFCYLRATDAGEASEPDGRERIEKNFDAALRREKLGCVVGTGFGPPSTMFIDLCLSDVDRAVPKLQELCRENKLPHTSWLQFYDADWRHESVRMFEDTPKCIDSEQAW